MGIFILVIIFGAATQLPQLRAIHFAAMAAIAAVMVLLDTSNIANSMIFAGVEANEIWSFEVLLRKFAISFAIHGGVFLAGFGLGRFLAARRDKS